MFRLFTFFTFFLAILAKSHWNWLERNSNRAKIIPTPEKVFPKLIGDTPRNFSLIIEFGLSTNTNLCRYCAKFHKQLEIVSQSYNNQLKTTKEKPEIFFILVEYKEANKEILQNLKIQNPPLLIYLPPSYNNKFEEYSEILLLIEPSDVYNVKKEGDYRLESINDYIFKVSGIKIDTPPTPEKIDFGFWISIIIIIAASSQAGYFIITTIWEYRHFRSTYALCFSVLYILCISGVPHNFIRPTGIAMGLPGGSFALIGRGMHTQLLLETLLVILLYTLIGGSWYYFFRLLKKNYDVERKDLYILLSAFLIYFGFRILRTLYTVKVGQYQCGLTCLI